MKEENREIIFDVWEKFKKETGNEVIIVNDINDAIRGEEYIYSRFTHVLSEKGMLSEEEVSKLHKNLNIIVGKFYEIQYKEKFDLDPKYISTRYSPSSHCLKNALGYYGIEFIVKTKYDGFIIEFQKICCLDYLCRWWHIITWRR